MSRRRVISWLTRPLFGLHDVGVWDLVVATVLGAIGVLSVLGVTDAKNHGDAGAALAVLTMTVPVVWARRQPLVAAGLLAAGAALNWGAYDHLVRCGVGLPAVFYVGFVLGSRCARWSLVAAGLTLLAVDLLCQSYADPQLSGTGPGVLGLFVPITVAFIAAGRLLRARTAAVARLSVETEALRMQREENARLAVATDQARIAGDLDGFLRQQVDAMADTAAHGRAVVSADPEAAAQAFTSIGDAGRETLSRMRTVVSGLKEPAPTGPQPMLAQLDHLLGSAQVGDARLQVHGDPRSLPPGIELAGYRIVEHLLAALESDPTAPIEVTVSFEPAALALSVTGVPGRRGDVRGVLAAVTERATLLGGSLRTGIVEGRRETVVLLPLASGIW